MLITRATIIRHIKYLPHHTLVGILYMVGAPFAIMGGVASVVIEVIDNLIDSILDSR